MPQNSPPPPESPQQPPAQGGPGGASGPKKASPLLPGGWIALVVLAVLAVVYFTAGQPKEIRYDQFNQLVNSGEVKTVVLIGNDRADGEVRNPDSTLAKDLKLTSGKFSVNLPHTNDQASLIKEWEAKDEAVRKQNPSETPTEKINISKRDDPSWVATFVVNLLVVAVLIGILVFFFLPRLRDPMGGGFMSSYTRSPAKRYEQGRCRVTLDQVAR